MIELCEILKDKYETKVNLKLDRLTDCITGAHSFKL